MRVNSAASLEEKVKGRCWKKPLKARIFPSVPLMD
jgi:hypothetical protein